MPGGHSSRAFGRNRKLTSLLLVNAELLPVLSLELLELPKDTVLLLLGKSLPAGLDVGDDLSELDLVGALDEGTGVAGRLVGPLLLLGDHGAAGDGSVTGGHRAETGAGSTDGLVGDHVDVRYKGWVDGGEGWWMWWTKEGEMCV